MKKVAAGSIPGNHRLALGTEPFDIEAHRIACAQINRPGFVTQADSWRRPRRNDVTRF